MHKPAKRVKETSSKPSSTGDSSKLGLLLCASTQLPACPLIPLQAMTRLLQQAEKMHSCAQGRTATLCQIAPLSALPVNCVNPLCFTPVSLDEVQSQAEYALSCTQLKHHYVYLFLLLKHNLPPDLESFIVM